MAEEAQLSKTFVIRELGTLLSEVEENLTDSPFTNHIQKRIKKLFDRLKS
jgi:hypothetical protein